MVPGKTRSDILKRTENPIKQMEQKAMSTKESTPIFPTENGNNCKTDIIDLRNIDTVS